MTDERLIEAARVAFVEAWEAERKKIGRGTAEPGTKTRAGIIAALAVFEKAHTVTERHSMSVTDSEARTPTDDERAIFEALADRLGEHQQARNYEIADSGEYETMLRGPIDVEVLAEWLTPTVLGLRRTAQGEPSDAQVEAAGALLYGISWGTDIADPDLVRDALRAVGGVR